MAVLPQQFILLAQRRAFVAGVGEFCLHFVQLFPEAEVSPGCRIPSMAEAMSVEVRFDELSISITSFADTPSVFPETRSIRPAAASLSSL